MNSSQGRMMAEPAARPTIPRKRTLSRGSTASIQSAATQANLENSYSGNAQMYSVPVPGQFSYTGTGRNPPAMNSPAMDSSAMMLAHMDQGADAAVLHASQPQSNREFSMEDRSMNGSISRSVSFHHPFLGHSGSLGADASFTDGDSQMMDRDPNDDDSVVGAPAGAGGGKAPRSSANNELEMRQLFQQSKHRTLPDVARELHGNDRGPQSERTRQVFAMLWLNLVCKKGKGSVPRGRVYANYASRCATEKITVLNPASFGKLVRVLFPGLKTRRLGVRGESKYHYVDFYLTEEHPDVRDASPAPLLENAGRPVQNFNRSTSERPEPAALPSPDIGVEPVAKPTASSSRSHEYSHSFYNQPTIRAFDELSASRQKTAIKLSLSEELTAASNQSDLDLPAIDPFLPSGTDSDAARSLEALYRSHCTSLVQCIRYCKEKAFFHLYTSFQGTLTMPVQKLFSHVAIAPWIEECDFALYQCMMRIVALLTLQVVPKQVLDTLKSISDRLVSHIRDAFQGQPAHVVRAREAPAVLFAGLLDRALRVNLTAHAAANMLTNPANRDQMYIDWVTIVRLRKVCECLPSRAMDDVVTLLLGELRHLLAPVNVQWENDQSSVYEQGAGRNGRLPRAGSGETDNDTTEDDGGTSTVIDRWVIFLISLTSRFPYASHTDIVWAVDRLGTAIMRELTIAQGKSFGSWWVTKCWIDEMILFLAEQGGFMSMKSTLDHTSLSATTSSASATASAEAKKPADVDGTSHNSLSGHPIPHQQQQPPAHSYSQPDRAPFPSAGSPSSVVGSVDTAVPTAEAEISNSSNHDDSGIGIRTPEEDYPDKFEFATADDPSQALMDAEMH